MVGRQPNAPADFTPGEIPGTHFQRLSRPQGTWFCRKEPRKKSQVTPPGIEPGTVRLVAQRLNHYAPPRPLFKNVLITNYYLNMLETEKRSLPLRIFLLFFRFQIFGSFQRRIFPFNMHQSPYSLEVLVTERNDFQEVYQMSKN